MTHTNALELKNRLENGEHLNIIDVREQEEYDEDNIGALLLPLSSVKNYETDAIDHLKDEEVILQCRGGQRSMQAAMILEGLGFANLVNLDGGILDWRTQLGNFNIK
ncbi:MAG TPA: rhodanese-like domain-containing protein [Edaphocola sp.]|nr:rhodanese-like domain-containing protein [Edaphocola sp.]